MGSYSFVRVVFGLVVAMLMLIFSVRRQKSGESILSQNFGRRASSPRDRNAEFIYYGATLIDEDSGYRPDWNAAMLREFGDYIEPELDRLFEIAQEVASHPRDEWVSQIKEYRGETI